MKRGPALRALALGVLIAGFAALLHVAGVGLPLLLGLLALIGVVAWALPQLGVRWLDAAVLAVRGLYWAREEGRFHSFGGVPLRIEDDGRHVWVDGEGLLRVLGRREPDEALAARHAGRWRHAEDGTLMLRVDAVVQQLGTGPGRDDPRILRLRRYFERDVLFPARQRRARG